MRRPHRRVVALASVCTLLALPTVAHAVSTQDRIAATKHAIDDIAQRWFDAQRAVAQIDDRIAATEQDIADGQTRVDHARAIARARAQLMYENSPVAFTSVIGSNELDFARRSVLMNRANEENDAAIEALTAALSDLKTQRQQLVDERARQSSALNDVASERDALDAQLASLTARAAKEDAAHRRPTSRVRVRRGSLTAPPTRPVESNTPARLVSSPAPAGGGVNPHHNDPFLVCTRDHESGGNYGAVSPGGVYYGAYQFLPSTWDATAVHAGRQDLVGVLPSHASEYDQDDMGWTLYQWQGKSPWGGRC